MNAHTNVRKLACLDDWQLEHPDQDLRGKTLVDLQGREIGRVDDMLADLEDERVVALRLHDNRIVNIANVDIRGGRPVLTADAAQIPQPADGFDREAVTTEHIPVIEETLDVGKREVDLGAVRIRSRVVSETVGENVTLRNEHVNVERRPAHEAISEADAEALLKDRTIDVTETGERVVVGKHATVTGEVVVDKEVDTRTERVEGVVRHTEVDVDRDAKRR
ncbi:YsnF/AvaK domain-containing protein [Novosphingobium sp. RD2P27]|uniref:YsnF/AvaK domain-containing protein n=1 Tax=Novosphingobium kalidii TaxID=3230299 RepID=A0ABV2D406_9SPHN